MTKASSFTSTALDDFVLRTCYELREAGDILFESGTLSIGRGVNAAVRIPDSDRLLVVGGLGSSAAQNLPAAAVYDLNGHYIDGDHSAGLAEVAIEYSAIFQARPEARAALHTHSPYLTGFAVAHRPVPLRYVPLLAFGLDSAIPYGDWWPRHAPEPLVKLLRQHPRTPAVLTANRGLLAWGSGIFELARFVVTLEEAAGLLIRAERLGGAKDFTDDSHTLAYRAA
jgi:ribulose-5-phosphate 4-epimerase/fuculose-1-phosphate aldolase